MVVRALVSLDDFRPDPKFLSRKLRGFVSPAEIEKSLELLVEIGLVKIKDGKYILSDKNIKTRDEINIAAGRHFHSEMIPVGIKALEKNSLEEREFQAITPGINDVQAREIKRRIKEFYREIVDYLALPQGDKKSRDVWQMNFQFFKFNR